MLVARLGNGHDTGIGQLGTVFESQDAKFVEGSRFGVLNIDCHDIIGVQIFISNAAATTQ